MNLSLARIEIRNWRTDDAPDLARYANNHAIWRNLRDRFPHPYAIADAEAYIAKSLAHDTPSNCAITLDDRPIGSIGIIKGEDIYRRSAEFGYWLGEPFWGRGYATEAIAGFSEWAFQAFDLVRLYAMVFTWNPGSARALEKCGFVREALCKSAAIKEGQVVDEWLYARTLPIEEPVRGSGA